MRVETWFHCRQPNPAARLRLLCFPYAGGGVSIFRAWPDLLPADIEVWAVQLPGRDGRRQEPIPDDLTALAAAAAEGLAPQLRGPFACFGHSMGALLAFEFVRALRRMGRPEPAQLIVSARRAPQLTREEAPLHALPQADFIRLLRQRYNSIPPAILAEPELLDLLLPIVRADFKMIESYHYHEDAPFDCSLRVFGGTQDEWAHPHELSAWQTQTRRPLGVQLFAGGHFYLQDVLPQLLAAVAKDLAQVDAPGRILDKSYRPD
jgi:medium-chain acyl-[acyl-carrier-protein] hydrolase